MDVYNFIGGLGTIFFVVAPLVFLLGYWAYKAWLIERAKLAAYQEREKIATEYYRLAIKQMKGL